MQDRLEPESLGQAANLRPSPRWDLREIELKDKQGDSAASCKINNRAVQADPFFPHNASRIRAERRLGRNARVVPGSDDRRYSVEGHTALRGTDRRSGNHYRRSWIARVRTH